MLTLLRECVAALPATAGGGARRVVAAAAAAAAVGQVQLTHACTGLWRPVVFGADACGPRHAQAHTAS